jgi:hypothetical protein
VCSEVGWETPVLLELTDELGATSKYGTYLSIKTPVTEKAQPNVKLACEISPFGEVSLKSNLPFDL